MRCLIFDCDGVILESEDLHRRAYNAAFEQFNVSIGDPPKPVEWSSEYYDDLSNTVGGGKPKMRHYFKQNGWPRSSVHNDMHGESGKATDEEQFEAMIDELQDWKSENYRELIASGEVKARPGVLRLMDAARAAGLKLAVRSAAACSDAAIPCKGPVAGGHVLVATATKESVVFTLTNLLGQQRFDALDCFLAGDDVPKKKPDPVIYTLAAERLGVSPAECMVVEDSQIGVDAALGANMRCIVTYTDSSKSQKFTGAEKVMAELGEEAPAVTVEQLMAGSVSGDDRS